MNLTIVLQDLLLLSVCHTSLIESFSMLQWSDRVQQTKNLHLDEWDIIVEIMFHYSKRIEKDLKTNSKENILM